MLARRWQLCGDPVCDDWRGICKTFLQDYGKIPKYLSHIKKASVCAWAMTIESSDSDDFAPPTRTFVRYAAVGAGVVHAAGAFGMTRMIVSQLCAGSLFPTGTACRKLAFYHREGRLQPPSMR